MSQPDETSLQGRSKAAPAMIQDLLERFRQVWSKFPKRGPVVLLFSGGGDSTALFRLLLESEVDFACLHFVHDSPGPFASRSLEFCGNLCSEHRVPFESFTLAVGAFRRQANDLSWEAAARTLRYAELSRRPTDTFLTAHSADDQAETLLMRLLDGSGLAGLAGIREVRDDGILRPLLDFSRQELRDYLGAREQVWLDDPSNIDGNRRARIRHGLLATLQREYPSLLVTLGRTARTLAADEDALTQIANHWLENHRLEGDHWPLEALRAQHQAVRYRVFRQLWRLTAGPGRRPLGGVFRECERLICGANDDRYVELPAGGRLGRVGGQLWVVPPLPPADWSVVAADFRPVHSSSSFWALAPDHADGDFLPPEQDDWLIVRLPAGVFDREEQYQLRSRRPGDRFEGKEVKKLLAVTGHPPWVRDRWPLLVRAGKVLAIPGVGTSSPRTGPRLFFCPGRLRWPRMLLTVRPKEE